MSSFEWWKLLTETWIRTSSWAVVGSNWKQGRDESGCNGATGTYPFVLNFPASFLSLDIYHQSRWHIFKDTHWEFGQPHISCKLSNPTITIRWCFLAFVALVHVARDKIRSLILELHASRVERTRGNADHSTTF